MTNLIKVVEGERYKHNLTDVIYTIKKNCNDVLQLDNNIIHVDATQERLNKCIKL